MALSIVMGTRLQDAVCAFAREILEARTGETIDVTDRPDVAHRDTPAVEELWESSSRRYAVEHTRIESFAGQIGNEASVNRVMEPVQDAVAGRIPGTYSLVVRAGEVKGGRSVDVGREIVRLVLEAAPHMTDKQTVTLQSDQLPFNVLLHRRHGRGSRVFVRCMVEGDGETLRLERVRRAFDSKCPKLAAWSGDERMSLLVLEADDIQLSNVFLVWEAVEQVIAERTDIPDVIIFVETDASPMAGWVFKDGHHIGDDVPMPDGRRCYWRGQFGRHRIDRSHPEPLGSAETGRAL